MSKESKMPFITDNIKNLKNWRKINNEKKRKLIIIARSIWQIYYKFLNSFAGQRHFYLKETEKKKITIIYEII